MTIRPRSDLGGSLRPRPSHGLLCAASLAVVVGLLSSDTEAKAGFDTPLVVTQVPGDVKTPTASWNVAGLSRSDWFERARVVVVSPEGQVRVLSEGLGSACDPNVSFDGLRVVFAGKKDSRSLWRIWEIGIDGQNLRPVSPENQDARSPIYASTLFTLDSPEPWFTLVYVAQESILNETGRSSASSLYNIKLDGTEPRRLTFNPNNNFDPFQMWDGRVIYAAERYPLEPAAGAGHVGLYGVHMVGTDMEFYGGEAGRRIQQMPCATDGGLVLFVESDEVTWDGAGQLSIIEEHRPHRTYKRLTSDPAWLYLYPAPWRGNQVLVSRRSADGQATCGICRFDAEKAECETVFDSPDYHDVQAQAVRTRPRPDGHSTIVEPAKYTTGVFYALNCYDADEKMLPHLPKGTFKRVRVIEGTAMVAGTNLVNPSAGLPVGSERKGPFVARRLLGEAPIEADGSFNIEVPADTPVLLQTLDERGLALGTCGWLWVKPRETRGCIGCHEDPELIPENNFVFALRRLSNKVTPPASQRRSVDFREAIVPILKNRCASVSCHGMPDAPVYLPLVADQPVLQDLQQAYAALRSAVEGGPGTPSPLPQRGKYVDAGRARTSPLIWRLFGADTSRPWDRGSDQAMSTPKKVKPMPPPDKGGPLSDEEIRVFVEWIDLGASWEAVKTDESKPSATKAQEGAH